MGRISKFVIKPIIALYIVGIFYDAVNEPQKQFDEAPINTKYAQSLSEYNAQVDLWYKKVGLYKYVITPFATKIWDKPIKPNKKDYGTFVYDVVEQDSSSVNQLEKTAQEDSSLINSNNQ